jgi:uncharacterized membrane protein
MRSGPPSDHHVIRELLIHGVAFCVVAAIGAAILWHFYWFFEQNTESPEAAREAFLAAIVIVGGVGPAITMLFRWVGRLTRRRP